MLGTFCISYLIGHPNTVFVTSHFVFIRINLLKYLLVPVLMSEEVYESCDFLRAFISL